MTGDPLRTDLRLEFRDDGSVDLALGADGLETIHHTDNLAQALVLRLLVDAGELARLGHRSYGGRIRELIGQPMDAANLDILRRLVRKALADEPRVASVRHVTVAPRPDLPGVVVVEASVVPVTGGTVRVELELDVR